MQALSQNPTPPLNLHAYDAWLTKTSPTSASGIHRFLLELFFFTLKQIRACLFVGLFFLAVLLIPRAGLLGLPRYDALLLVTLAIQTIMVATKLESLDELKAITLFHIIGFALELFKVSSHIQSWAYPDFAYTKIAGVPLFSGFMYSAIGSYIIQAWRLFDLKIKHHPPFWMATTIATLIYLNFFTHHYIGDYRWYLAACAIGLYSRSYVIFTPLDRPRRMPLLLSFCLIGFFIWLAENISTLFGIWSYPHQIHSWSLVHLGKWSSWSLLILMTFTITANLKHIKHSIHIPHET